MVGLEGGVVESEATGLARTEVLGDDVDVADQVEHDVAADR